MSILVLADAILNYHSFRLIFWKVMDECNKVHGLGLVPSDLRWRLAHNQISDVLRKDYKPRPSTDKILLTEEILTQILKCIYEDIDSLFEEDISLPKGHNFDTSAYAKRLVLVEFAVELYKRCFNEDVIDVPLTKRRNLAKLLDEDIDFPNNVSNFLGISVDIYRVLQKH